MTSGIHLRALLRLLLASSLLLAAAPRCVFAQASAASAAVPGQSTPVPAAPQASPAPDPQKPGDNAPAPSAAPGADASTETGAPRDMLTLFPHSETARWYVGGQANGIFQWHDRFAAAYSGPHSFYPAPQTASSRVETLYTGLQLAPDFELLMDIEDATGHGLSNTLGIAGFPDLDAVRASGISDKPYFARMMMHWIIPLGGERVSAARNSLNLATSVPERRLEVRLGKFGMVDFFDMNAVGTDSHLQFLGWGIDNNAAYDYAADTHGYTYGLVVEYDQPHLVLRYAEALEPTVANGNTIEFNITKAHSENFEAELHRNLLHEHETVLRLLSFANHADMGSYREAIANFLAAETPVPDIVATRQQGRIKYGFGANLEQNLPQGWRAFARFGWNNGTTESWAYTECDQAVSLGVDHDGAIWRRPHDRAGLAVDTLAISGDHRRYLALGGLGFLLGDGALTYGRERSLEFYYTTHLWRGIFAAFDIQRVTNPGYNQARGPVVVPGVRLHLEF